MKTAISLPDKLFRRAERARRRLGVSRSELYARALDEFVDAQLSQTVTDQLNEVYAGESSRVDDVLSIMQAASLPRKW